MSKSKKQKRIFLINRDFQMRYIRAAVLVAFCSTALTIFFILYPLFYLNVLRFPNFMPAPFLIACIFAAIMNFTMIAYLGVRLSHRIAGPVFAMVRYLRILQNGQYADQMRVRDSDELKYLARHINELGEILRNKTKSELAQINEIIKVTENCDSAWSKEDKVRLTEICEKLKLEYEERIATGDPEANGPITT